MKYIQTAIQCPECGNITYIFRKQASQKKIGHLKKLYCYKCKKEVNQVEVKDPMMCYVDNNTDLTPVNKNNDKIKCEHKEADYNA